jgi:hypothetical protein
MIFLCVPEKKQRTLEELDYVSAVPTSTFKALPDWINSWVLFQRSARLEPLNRFDDVFKVDEKQV